MPSTDSKREKAREVVDILEEISMLLNTQLDRTQLSLCVSLIENGVNPEALATAIKELRRETQDLQHQDAAVSE
ncbi:mitotic-spindle organizing gamma-tubulin ring associated-domain-containing protein [Exophiala viscosa]|uniref:Mitotic-spindle organizing protein 1 n=1 Tax=Exophiala viscosa TaxID=2486360 RepID=A0AAN6IE20_9EURO|nr:mitotic-spindle organizing gamma-tubulin ring associated-domain-containing protein [Exophiala viscosa]